jgi:hypothetical protein
MEDTVFLPWPIVTLTKLWVYDDRTVGKTDNDLWASTDYYFETSDEKQAGKITAENGALFGEYPFVRNMVLEGTFGYDEEEDPEAVPALLPANVRKATAIIAATYSLERRLEQTNLEGNRIELIELNIPTDVYKLLNKFRNYSHML